MSQLTRRDLFRVVSAATPALWLARTAAAQSQSLKLEPLSSRLSILTGAGSNTTVLRGAEGILVVDTGASQAAEAFERTVLADGKAKITTVIITHYHFDHIGANERLGASGARIIAHENVLKRLSTPQKMAFFGNQTPALAPAGRPSVTFTDGGTLQFAGEKVVYKHVPPTHTDGDSTVFFSNDNVLQTGDLYFNGLYPFIDYTVGGSIERMVAAADKIIAAVDAKTKIVPGHGPVSNRDEYRTFRDMLADIGEKVGKLVKEGKTLQEAQAAQPTKAYDAKWGKAFLKPDQFVRLVYGGMKGSY